MCIWTLSGQRSSLCVSRHPRASGGAEASPRRADDGGGEEEETPARGAEHLHLPLRGNAQTVILYDRRIVSCWIELLLHKLLDPHPGDSDLRHVINV